MRGAAVQLQLRVVRILRPRVKTVLGRIGAALRIQYGLRREERDGKIVVIYCVKNIKDTI